MAKNKKITEPLGAVTLHEIKRAATLHSIEFLAVISGRVAEGRATLCDVTFGEGQARSDAPGRQATLIVSLNDSLTFPFRNERSYIPPAPRGSERRPGKKPGQQRTGRKAKSTGRG